MAKHGGAASSMFAIVALVLAAFAAMIPTAVESIGVCYGKMGDNLPPATDVVQMYQSKGLTGMRIYSPDNNVLQALAGTGIPLIMDTGNGDHLSNLASNFSNADSWVQTNVMPHQGKVNIKYIAVGNGASEGETQNILPAMENLNAALTRANINSIMVSTSVSSGVTAGFPPSAGTFNANSSYMTPIVQYLAITGAPLLANVYPYFAYVGNPRAQPINISYALFTDQGKPRVPDGSNSYTNLFDAMVDTFVSALENVGAGNVSIVVSESAWPSGGGTPGTASNVATASNAQTYNQNLINHVVHGTPKRPGPLETYIFAMFNENNKTGLETENHFGLFNPDKTAAYTISF